MLASPVINVLITGLAFVRKYVLSAMSNKNRVTIKNVAKREELEKY